MNDKTSKNNDATGSLFCVTYKYVNNNGLIRAGQIVFPAKDAKEAHELAEKRLETLGVRYPRINTVKAY